VIGTTLAYLFLAAALWGLFRQQSRMPSWKQKIWLAGILTAIAAAGAVGFSNFIEDTLGL
jgi:cytochrome c oxidase assembly factor CtaG